LDRQNKRKNDCRSEAEDRIGKSQLIFVEEDKEIEKSNTKTDRKIILKWSAEN
jgi:hypothetical protein